MRRVSIIYWECTIRQYYLLGTSFIYFSESKETALFDYFNHQFRKASEKNSKIRHTNIYDIQVFNVKRVQIL